LREKVHPMSTSMAQRQALALKINEAINAPDPQPCLSLTDDAQAQAEALETLNRWQARKGPLLSAEMALAQRHRVKLTIARRQTTGKAGPRV
jgi:hypothetical protein